MKVCVIDIETMKTAKDNGCIELNSGIERDASKIEATRLICIPGERPVIVPIKIPNKIAKNISNSI